MDGGYTKMFFNKDIYDITEQDILDFFKTAREESSIMEFKSGNVKLEKIYNEVAALHNSQGGLLIIGSPIPKKDDKGKESFLGELTRSNFKTKDWLYQKIYSNISPAPINLKIHDIKCDNNGIIQILDIPKSINPPHQVLTNGVYYIRYETETKFAPHGLVEALFNRRSEPNVNIDHTFTLSNENLNRSIKYNFVSSIYNTTDIPVMNIKFIIKFYNVLKIEKDRGEIEKEDLNNINIEIFLDRDSIASNSTSLVKGLSLPFSYMIHHFSEPFFIGVYVWGDNMKLKKICLLISPLDNQYRELIDYDESIIELMKKEVKDILDKNYKEENLDLNGFNSLLNKLNKFPKTY